MANANELCVVKSTFKSVTFITEPWALRRVLVYSFGRYYFKTRYCLYRMLLKRPGPTVQKIIAAPLKNQPVLDVEEEEVLVRVRIVGIT